VSRRDPFILKTVTLSGTTSAGAKERQKYLDDGWEVATEYRRGFLKTKPGQMTITFRKPNPKFKGA